MAHKKAQAVIVFIMVAIIAFIMATQFISPVKTQIEYSMNESGLNCSNPDISATTQAACSVIDMGFFYFMSVCFAVGIALVSGKRTLPGIMTAIFVFVVVVVMITPLKTWIIDARADLSCGSSGLTVGTSLLCIFTDLWLFYFVATAIAAGITFIVAKRVLPEVEG